MTHSVHCNGVHHAMFITTVFVVKVFIMTVSVTTMKTIFV